MKGDSQTSTAPAASITRLSSSCFSSKPEATAES
jgi:hypothetical protein